jgi:WD40 repeat protein
MPTTRRTAKFAARARVPDLPTDVVARILAAYPLAHQIAAHASVSRTFRDAVVKHVFVQRPFSSKVVTLGGLGDRAIATVATAAHVSIMIGFDDGSVSIYDAHMWVEKPWLNLQVARDHQGRPDHCLIEAMASMPINQGVRFVTGDEHGAVKLWTPTEESYKNDLDYTFEKVGDRAVSVAALDGERFFVSYFTEDTEEPYDGDFSELRLYGPDDVHGTVFATGRDPFSELRVTRDGEHVIAIDDCYIKVWSIEKKLSGASCLVGATYSSGIAIEAVAVTPDSQRIISADRHNRVQVWLLDGTHERTFLDLHKRSSSRTVGNRVKLSTNRITGLEALPDSKHAMSSSMDGIIKIFGLLDGAVLRTISRPGPVWEIKLLHDGRRFVFVQEDPESGDGCQRVCIAEHGMNK